MLFCIIDGISLYENDDWMKETCYILRRITDLTHDPEIQATFKLLVTSPLVSRYIAKTVLAEELLAMPREVPDSDVRSLTQRHLALQSRQGLSHEANPWTEEGFEEGYEDEGFVEGDFDDGNISE